MTLRKRHARARAATRKRVSFTGMLELVELRGGVASGLWRRVQIQSWSGVPSVDALRVAFQATQRLLARYGDGAVSLLSVASGALGLPSAEARQLSGELMVKLSGRQIASATVVEGTGFTASAARAAVTGILLFSRTRTPHKIFSAVDAAAAWLGGYHGLTSAEVSELAAAARELRRRHVASIAAV
jgi:hypothetical protein